MKQEKRRSGDENEQQDETEECHIRVLCPDPESNRTFSEAFNISDETAHRAQKTGFWQPFTK
jgi:Mg2+ and Co2+ transporter CorA